MTSCYLKCNEAMEKGEKQILENCDGNFKWPKHLLVVGKKKQICKQMYEINDWAKWDESSCSKLASAALCIKQVYQYQLLFLFHFLIFLWIGGFPLTWFMCSLRLQTKTRVMEAHELKRKKKNSQNNAKRIDVRRQHDMRWRMQLK